MKKTLKFNLKHFAAPAVIQRGRRYFQEGHVLFVKEEEPGHWYAEVEGRGLVPYEVYIGLDPEQPEIIVSWECSCPYDWGGMCKHVVACLYALEAHFEKQSSSGTQAPAKAAAKREDKDNEARSKKAKLPWPSDLVERARGKSGTELYYLLPQDLRLLVEVLAMQWTPASESWLWDVLKEMPINRVIQKHHLRPALELLQRLGLVRHKAKDEWEVVHDTAQQLCEALYQKEKGFIQAATAIRTLKKRWGQYNWFYHRPTREELFQEMRMGRYLNSTRIFQDAVRMILRDDPEQGSQDILELWLGAPMQIQRLTRYPIDIRTELVRLWLPGVYEEGLEAHESSVSWMLQTLKKDKEFFSRNWRRAINVDLSFLFLLTGRFDWLEEMQSVWEEPAAEGFLMVARCWQEGLTVMAPAFKEVMGTPFGRMRRTITEYTGFQRYIGILAILAAERQGRYAQFEERVHRMMDAGSISPGEYPLLDALLGAAQFFLSGSTQLLEGAAFKIRYNIDALFLQLFRHWCGLPVDKETLEELAAHYQKKKFVLWEAEARQLLIEHGLAPEGQQTNPPKEALGIRTLAEQLKPRPAWEVFLDQLENLGEALALGHKPDNQKRVAWFFDPQRQVLEAKIQQVSVRTHSWTRGRRTKLLDLKYDHKELLSQHDHRLMSVMSDYVYSLGYEVDLKKYPEVLLAMVGHPHIFLADSPDVQLHFDYAEPSVHVVPTSEGYRFQLSPEVQGKGIHLQPLSRNRYLVVEVPEHLEPMLHFFRQKDFVVPPEAGDRLKGLLARLRPHLPILSEEDLAELPKVPADSRIHVHFLSTSPFELELLVRPMPDGLYLPAGRGDELVISFVKGERMVCQRNFKEERSHMRALKNLPAWKKLERKRSSWIVPDRETLLEFLLELRPLVEAGKVVVDWPEDKKMQVTRELKPDDLKVRVVGSDYWFSVEGQVQVDEDKLWQLTELFDLLDAQGRFIELKPGEFVALTERLARQLKRLKALAEKKKGELRVSKLGALALEELVEEGGTLEVDETFEQSLEKARAAFAKNYKVPSSKLFTAKLRPYQREGYVWLRRLADWGVGACLADDMGLGKTVQALALMSVRAKQGPQLVVAPASVCRNWVAETRKFAPALEPLLFGEGDREQMIGEVGPGHLVIVTYDLMAREADLFASKKWATIILDEAQAIKNYQTNRSKAAMRLEGDFRIIMTGTPVENHLGELWNLFSFINPGLLGDRESFRKRFALPIEAGDELAREQLKRLVRPFILRRRKDEVLKDLPEKTEIVLDVPLTKEEQTFYEALRINALKKLSEGGASEGQRRMQILAELTRLRLAACHPRLVDPQAPVQHSSKLNLFSELVEELVDGGHKALVFSQFVKHLKLLEEVLQAKGIAYQYLDGQTPLRVRQQRIEAFQRGEGDVFLISLKAGGTGLNLTAADYVIHMDPWWNPAVEDQATDRAHRIGQERPVTVYRLVATRTIEEKILKLHEEKRDLADALLAGTDASARLSLEDLMQLLQE